MARLMAATSSMNSDSSSNGRSSCSRCDARSAICEVMNRNMAKVLRCTTAAGSATIEAYTVMFTRDGAPETALAACLLADGRRAWGTSSDTVLATAMCDGEWVGRTAHLDPEGVLSA